MAFRCHAGKVDPNERRRETRVVASSLGLMSFSVSFAQSVFSPIPISIIPERP